jgi:hypothetical protein
MAVGGLRIDEAVTRVILEAVQPVCVQTALSALQELEQHEGEELRALRLALEKARYEVQRARRQYDAVDPENRLVASELERRWNQAIEQATELESRVAELESRRPSLTDGEAERLLALGCDLETVWGHPAASIELKKRIVRTVLKEIVVTVREDPPRTELCLHWHGGVHTTLSVARNPRGKHGHATKQEVLDLICELSRVCGDREIAAVLNRLGYRTGQGNSWHASRVADARCHHRMPKYTKSDEWLTMSEAAEILHVSTTVIQRLIAEGKLPATQVVKCAPWIITRVSLSLPAVQADIAMLRGGRRRPLIRPDQRELPLK